jgi:signal transduction histidine kinase
MRTQHVSNGSVAPENFDQARLEATFRACRTLRHELATPLSAASLHLELARRSAERVEGGIPGKLRSGLETGKQQLDAAAQLLDGLVALGGAHAGEPSLVDFAALVRRAARDTGPELERRGLSVLVDGPPEWLFADGFVDELEPATREALIAAARWAAPGEARLRTESDGASIALAFRVPLAGSAPGEMLFKTRSRPNAGLGPFLARWTFEAHGGSLEGEESGSHLTVTASLPQVAP